MSGNRLFRVAALAAVVPLMVGCSNDRGLPVDAGGAGHPTWSSETQPWRSWEPGPAAILTVWSDPSEPPLVLRGSQVVCAAIEALPAPARHELMVSGIFETSDPLVARELWLRIGNVVTAKQDRPDAEIEKTTWGTIKIIFS